MYMIPLRTIRNDIFGAFCVISILGGAFYWSNDTDSSTLPTPSVARTQPASVVTTTFTPTSTPLTSTTIQMDTPTTTEEVTDTTTTAPKVSKLPARNVPTATATTHPVHTTTATPPVPQPVINQKVSDVDFTRALTKLINEQTNKFRVSNHLPALSTDTTLARNAARYSATMLAGNFLEHTDKNGCDLSCRFAREEYSAWTWGENLAVLHFTNRPTPEYVAVYFMHAWEKSSGHRANLLTAAFTHTGIGVAMHGTNIYVTVQFAKPQ